MIRGWATWAWILIVAAVAVVSVVGLFARQQFSWGGVLLGVVTVVAIFAFLAVRNGARLAAVQRMYPASFVGQVIVYPELSAQWDALSSEFVNAPKKMRSSRYVTVVADRSWIRFYRGSGKPIEIARVSGAIVRDVSVVKAQQGNWRLDSMELQFHGRGGPLLLDLCLLEWRYGFPHVVRGAELSRDLDLLRAVLAQAK